VAVMGVDGCRGGWVAVTLNGSRAHWDHVDDVRLLLARGVEVVAIDIPIGLPDDGVRVCDVEARRLLGRRGASVFAAPVRPVLGCGSYAEARELLAARGGASMSAQAFGIVRSVAAVDAALTPAEEQRVVEAHPELAFARMGGHDLAPKKTARGAAQRLALLHDGGIDAVSALADAPGAVPLDDAVDALACAWVARRWAAGTATVLGDGARDARGLLMRIVA
jgi:predicted RNase H-like nuclease